MTYKHSPSKAARIFAFAPKRLIYFRESLSFHGWEVDETNPAQPKYDNALSLYLQRCQEVQMTERNVRHISEPPYAQESTKVGPFALYMEILLGYAFSLQQKRQSTFTIGYGAIDKVWSCKMIAR